MSATEVSPACLAPHGGTLAVHLLGLVEYDALLGLQEQQIYEISGQSDLSGVLFICEHPPTITMGRDASIMDLSVSEEELARREIPVRWVARGGGAFVHAPGQIAIYLQIPLQRLNVGLEQFRALFEQAVIQTCRENQSSAKRQPGETGVWSRGGQLAYFGAGVKSWVSCQGMFLNVSIDRRLLELTTPNPGEIRSTSMQSLRLDPVRMPRIRESLIRHLAEGFGYTNLDLFTGHPQLVRTRQKVSVGA